MLTTLQQLKIMKIQQNKFILACNRQNWLKKTSNFYNKLINSAFDNGDKESVVRLYIDILDYQEIILSANSINKVLESVPSHKTELLDHIKEYISQHFSSPSFATHMLFAAHSSDNSEELNIHLANALEAGKSTGNVFLIKSELIQQELLAKYKSHNSILQSIISEFKIEDVSPEDSEFYDWKIEGETV